TAIVLNQTMLLHFAQHDDTFWNREPTSDRFLARPAVHFWLVPVARFPLVLINPVAAHLEGKPRQRVVLGARDHRKNAECDEQTHRSNHPIYLTRRKSHAALSVVSILDTGAAVCKSANRTCETR